MRMRLLQITAAIVFGQIGQYPAACNSPSTRDGLSRGSAASQERQSAADTLAKVIRKTPEALCSKNSYPPGLPSRPGCPTSVALQRRVLVSHTKMALDLQNASLPASAAPQLGQVPSLVVDRNYDGFSSACSAAGSTGTLAVTRIWDVSAGTYHCSVWFIGEGQLRIAASSTATMAGVVCLFALPALY